MFEEEPIWYPIYSSEFEKSTTLLTDLDELEEDYYIDENGVKRRRKGFNLRDLEISEISLCGAGKVNKTYLIRKGDEEMRKAITLKPGELKTVRETIKILDGYDLDAELSKAKETLIKNFAKREPGKYPYPTKKSDNFKWSDNTQRTLQGYSDSDLEEIDEEDLEIGVEKSTSQNPFPSLSRIFNKNIQGIEERIEYENIESRFV